MKLLVLVGGIALSLIFMVGCSTTPAEQAYNNLEPAPVKSKKEKPIRKNLVFPKAIAGMPFLSIDVHEANHPGYGVAYQYGNEETQVDISIFDRGHKDIEDGIFSEGVHRYFEEGKAQIAAVERQGHYSIREIETDDWIMVGGQAFLHFKFSFSDHYGLKSSHLLMTGYNGQFLKIRLTTLDEELKDGVFEAFRSDFGRLLSGTTTS